MTEIEQIKNKLSSGQYASIVKDLRIFLEKNARYIAAFKNSFTKKSNIQALSDEMAIKFYILKTRSINPVSEIHEEMKEIEDEIWVRGEKNGGNIDRIQVAKEWCLKYAAGWRDHRVLSIVYVFDQDKETYLRVYNEALTRYKLVHEE